jgi:UDP-3-O-[3-hydroxymyristoyl] N-acetylglucosamine deacetylase
MLRRIVSSLLRRLPRVEAPLRGESGAEAVNLNGFKSVQSTIRTPASCAGVGLHSGAPVSITLLPAEPDTGIVFRRTDLSSDNAYIPARFDCVTTTELGTTLANARGISVATVEHLMSALSGLGVDNVVIEVSGPEIPIMDGSARPFVELIDRAGIEISAEPKKTIRVLKQVVIEEGNKRAALIPAETFTARFEIEFPSKAIGHQEVEFEVSPLSFRRFIAPARTFGFLREVEYLRSKGLALGGSLENAIVVSEDVILNSEPLRFKDEFVRHKVLDAVGDLALAGRPLIARYEGVKAGHELNNRLLRALFADSSAWRLESPAAEPRIIKGYGVLSAPVF